MKTDENFKSLLEKVSMHDCKQSVSIRGSSYQLGDFSLRIGILSRAKPEFVVVEIEYKPLLLLDQAEPILKEFSESLGLDVEWVSQRFDPSIYGLTVQYEHGHACLQYLKIFHPNEHLKSDLALN